VPTPTLEANLGEVQTALADIPTTQDTPKLFRAAARQAAEQGRPVRPSDVLRALIAEPGGLAAAVLQDCGVQPAAVQAQVAHAAEAAAAPPSGLRTLAVHAWREAQQIGHHRVDPAH